MSLDLFFHARKTDFDTVRAADYTLSAAQLRARRKQIDALLARYPQSRLVGDCTQGYIADFPVGELQIFPGYLHLSFHGKADGLDRLRVVVDGLSDDGWLCVDPQDAGFATGSPTRMQSFDELLGSQFTGLSLLREWVCGIALDLSWDDGDGRTARIEFVRASGCSLPDPVTLLKARVIKVDYGEGATEFEDLKLEFDTGAVLQIHGCLFNKGIISPPRRRAR
jgi:hypothetical protein